MWCEVFRGARSSRVRVLASRQDELPSRVAGLFVPDFSSDVAGKSAKAGRLRQHSGRARSPESADQRPEWELCGLVSMSEDSRFHVTPPTNYIFHFAPAAFFSS